MNNLESSLEIRNLDLQYIINGIVSDIEIPLKRAGVFYRIFSRTKSFRSIEKKIELKKSNYIRDGKKMQDIIGIRIVFYFLEDVDVYANYLKNQSNYINESNSYKDLEDRGTIEGLEQLTDKIFMPTRLNLVFKMNESHTDFKNNILRENIKEADLIDSTYEIQLRSVLSEGWHEIEHDLRYKCKTDEWWNYCHTESRMLNGIYATLETSERAMANIFATMALKNYKEQDWAAMFRNHFCIRLADESLPKWLIDLLNSDKNLPKQILKFSRIDLLNILFKLTTPYPLKIENLIFLINRVAIKNIIISDKENSVIKRQLDRIEGL